MESEEERHEFRKKLNVMTILSNFIVEKPEQYGQGDEKTSNTVSFTPSEYKKQLLMPTEERLDAVSRVTQKLSHSSAFKVTPEIIIFQQFAPGNIYNTTITITNTDKESHFVKIVSENNAEFCVEFKGLTLNTRLAPGMCHIYNVQFSPEEKKDHNYQMDVLTEREKFSIPIIAIGPRAILNFPDIITMPETAVKVPCSISIAVRNLGELTAIFKLHSTNSQFSIEPAKGILRYEQIMQFTVKFHATDVGNFSGLFFLQYETGELIRIKIQGATINCNVYLETNESKMDDTFLGLYSDKRIKIVNDSDYVINYEWMKHEDVQTDNEEKAKFIKLFGVVKEVEASRYIDLEYFEICDAEVHEKICERIYTDEVSSLSNENFLYTSKHFSLTPMKGETWPHATSEILVTFHPQEIGEISTVAHLEIAGREVRLPLNLSGLCKGPTMRLNTSTIEIKTIYLCSTENFEIIVSNVGFIPGTLIYQEKPTDFGGSIVISPPAHEIAPNQYKSFNLSFSSRIIGEFIERIDFIIEESSEIISLYLKGMTICPNLHFNKPVFDLGPTGIGFTSVAEVMLQNQSSISVSFKLLIPDDGDEAPLTYQQFMQSIDTLPPLNPREFTVTPDQGILEAHASMKISVSFTPNILKKELKALLRVMIEGSDGIPSSLPIFGSAEVADIEIRPKAFNLRFCFINFPYTLSFRIKNSSNVDGFCYFARQSGSERSTIFYSLSRSQWHLKPGESKMASITVITKIIGRQEIELNLMTLGSKGSKQFLIICTGQGPVVSILSNRLDFGDVRVLAEKSMTLKLINDSPIPADFNATIENKNSPWSICTKAGEILPLTSVKLAVNLFLRDVGKHSGKLIMEIVHRPPVTIFLSATGVGSSIIIEPNIFPDFDMGILLSHQENIRMITVKNEGSKWQKLSFSNNVETRNKGAPQVPTSQNFFIDPFAFELAPGTCQEIKFTARSDRCDSVTEEWWIQGISEGQGKRELIGKSAFSAKFVKPSVVFNKKELTFHVNVGADDESCSEKLTDDLEMTNNSGLMLNVKISVKYPFKIVTEDDYKVQMMNVVLFDDDTRTVTICFDPNDKSSNLRSRTYDGRLKLEYDGQSCGITIQCKASVNFPNVLPVPKTLTFNAPLGRNAERTLVLKNEGSMPVHYKLSWIQESVVRFSIEKSISARISENDYEGYSEAEEAEEFSEITGIEERAEKNEIPEEMIEPIDELFQISKSEGVIPPNLDESILLIFHSQRPMTLEAELLCEGLHGPPENIKILAKTDIIKYKLDRRSIDFGYHNIFTPLQEMIILENLCGFDLNYEIKVAENFEIAKGILEVVPSNGIVLTGSSNEIHIIYKPLIPGNFEDIFTLKICNSSPIDVTVKGCALLPQVYLNLPHNWQEKKYSTKNEYLAIQSLHYSEDPQNSSPLEFMKDHQRLFADHWVIIYNNEIVPKIVDIDMAVERYLATEYINANKSLLSSNFNNEKARPIPYFHSAEYIFDVNYLITEQLVYNSLLIYNYSPHKLAIRIKKPEKKNYLSKYGVDVRFRNQESLMPGEFCKLDISIQPPRAILKDMSKRIKRKIYLEIINGCTVPVLITGIVTSPCIDLSANILHFEDVIVGNCKIMSLEIKNRGLIDCKWGMKIFSEGKPIEFPFSLSCTRGTYVPEQSDVISVYFKPRRGGVYESEVVFEIFQGKSISLMLTGKGIEQKLKMSESNINFSPEIPCVTYGERKISIKNLSRRPVELSWQHLDELCAQEERIIRILTHYYGTKEILLPVRELGCTLPKKLYDFYEELVDELSKVIGIESGGNLEAKEGKPSLEVGKEIMEVEKKKKKKRKSSVHTLQGKKSAESFVSTSKTLEDGSTNDELKEKLLEIGKSAEEIERLLHDYIEKLHENLDFEKNMKDPVAEIFDEIDVVKNFENSTNVEEEIIADKKHCVIFYGAPFTKYQETACKVSKVLEIPLLNLNSAITEVIAYGNSSSSMKIREMIDLRYRELLVPAMKLINDNSTSRTDKMNSTDLKESEEDYLKGNCCYTFPEPPDPVISFERIPDFEELEMMDPLSRYEYKIEGIILLENILCNSKQTAVTKSKTKTKESARIPKVVKNKGEISLNIDSNLLSEILEEILMMEKYRFGFILQTLKNHFIADDTIIVSKILNFVPQEFIKFITFHNSLEIYERKVTEKRSEIAREESEKLLRKLKAIDEMSLSEFEELPEEDQNLFIENIQRPRIKEARERRAKFEGKFSNETTKDELEDPSSVLAPLPNEPSKKPSKKMKDQPSKKEETKKKETGRRTSAKKEKQKESNGIDAVAEAIETYNKNVEIIVAILDDEADIWFAVSNDPWESTIYDLIIRQITQKEFENNVQSKKMTSTLDAAPKCYSIYHSAVSNQTKRVFSPLSKEIPFKICKDLDKNIVDPRIILQPHEIKSFNLMFEPKKVGNFHHEFYLSVVGNYNQVYSINLSGNADIPHLNMDPRSIFLRISEAKINQTHDPTFFLDTMVFDFGSLLIVEKDRKVHSKISKFNFHNPSLINVNGELSLEDGNSAFSLEEISMVIAPGENKIVKVTAVAPKLGLNEDTLAVAVKNNEQIEKINLRSFGCKLDVELDGKILTFGRILLYRKDCRRITLKNKCAIPIFWKLMESDFMDNQLEFSSHSGSVKAFDEINFDIHYHAKIIGIVDKKIIPVGIFLDASYDEPLLIENIQISAEIYDVSIDINYANPIDLKTVKIGEKSEAKFTLKNRGKYDVNYVIELEKLPNISGFTKNLFKNFNDTLRLNPSGGILSQEKLIIVNVEFIPRIEMELKETKILKCNIFDTSKDPALIAEIPLTVSILSRYSKFIIEPFPKLFCGPVSICTHKATLFSIKNTGIFPIDYTIATKSSNEIRIQENEVVKERKEKVNNESTKLRKKSKILMDSLLFQIGPFTLNKKGGSIEVGAIEEISVDCYPEIEGCLINDIVIHVSNPSPEDEEGRSLTLCLESCIPKINFNDFTSIFYESHIVDAISDFSCDFDVPHSIFAKNEKCLYFEKIIVLNPHKVGLKFYNPSLVSAEVNMDILSDSLSPEGAGVDIFTVEPKNEVVPAMSSRLFEITFKPALIENYSCTLSANVLLPPHLDNEHFQVKLFGGGCMPGIILVEPQVLCKHGNASLEFGRCLIEETSSKMISFKNTGKIKARVILEICEDDNSVYSLKIDDYADTLSQNVENITDDHLIEITCNCGDTSRILVSFKPNEIGISQAFVRIFVFENPYEVTTIDLRAEGFIEAVVIKGLPLMESPRVPEVVEKMEPAASPVDKKKSKGTKSKKNLPAPDTAREITLQVPSLYYGLDFGVGFLNEEKILSFSIVNKSDDKYFRFEFDVRPFVHFIPSTGRLTFLESKRIKATFCIDEAASYTQMPLDCTINEISPIECPEGISWDNQQVGQLLTDKNLEESFEEDSNALLEINYPIPEPGYEIISKASQSIKVLISALAAYTIYSCSVDEINFEDTFVLQRCVIPASKRNPFYVMLDAGFRILGALFGQLWKAKSGWSLKLNFDSLVSARNRNHASIAVKMGYQRSPYPASTAAKIEIQTETGIPLLELAIFGFPLLISRCERNCTFELTNPGTVDLIYFWNIVYHGDDSLNSMNETSELESPQNAPEFNEEIDDDYKTNNSLLDISATNYSEKLSRCFRIVPESGAILPSQSNKFCVKFQPEDNEEYHAMLICRIDNLDPQISPLMISITGKGLSPYYHFELINDDDSTRNKIKNLPDDAKLIEFNVMGVGELHTTQFNLVNPTTKPYKFSWNEKIAENSHGFSYFHCETPGGTARKGETTKMIFTFLARDIGMFKSFWTFTIKEYGLEVPFHLIGIVSEALVTCCPSRVELKSTNLGDRVGDSIILRNDENVALSFSIVKNSLFSIGRLQYLHVEPMEGILKAKSEESLEINLKPTIVGEFTFTLMITVEKVKKPLEIFISGRVCDIIPRVVYIDRNNETVEIRLNYENIIDLGKLMIKNSVIINFEISNMGELPFNYQWDLGIDSVIISKNIYSIKIDEFDGKIEGGASVMNRLSLMALKRIDLKNHPVIIKITKGPIFKILLKASAKRSSIEFSFSQHNFGSCYIRESSKPYVTLLKISNNDDIPAIVECDSKDSSTFGIECNFLSEEIPGQSSVSVPIAFHPSKEEKYEECFKFKINSIFEQRIILRGEGILYKINLAKSQDKLIDLGHVPLGKATKRKLSIINSGKLPVELRIHFPECTHTEIENGKSMVIHESVKIQPSQSILLPPNKPKDFVIKFKPRQRITAFEEKIGAHIDSTFIPLSFLRGKCLAPEFSLNRTIIQFDGIIEGFTEEQKLVLNNSGDVGGKFKWNTKKLFPNFVLHPTEGYSSPGTNITFNIKFIPVKKSKKNDGEAVLEIESYRKIVVSFTGSCQGFPEPKEILNFMIPVRKEEVKQINIENNLNIIEKLEVILSGNFFSCEKFRTISPKSSTFIEVKYLPLVMNNDENPHEGKLVIKFFHEKSIHVYQLRGISMAPEPIARIFREIPAKKNHIEIFSVSNWLNKTQYFYPKIDLLSNKGNSLYSFTGNDKIVITAKGKRDYQAFFHCSNESILNFKVSFTNSTGEYEFYEVEYKIIKCEILKTIELKTHSRMLKNYYLEIVNPLEDKSVNYITAICDNSDITIEGIPKTLAPNCIDKIEIKYHPMFPSESREILEIQSSELGNFLYELKLNSSPSPPENITNISVALGSYKKFSIFVKNSSKKNAEFLITVDEPFSCKENTITVLPDDKMNVEIIYEPFGIERVETNLIAFSETAGEIIYPLIGMCTLPKPQGPFTLTSNKPVIIPFKNVFQETKTFQYIVDPTLSFSTSSASNVINPKETANIIVSFRDAYEDESEKALTPITGKLIVYCTDPQLCHIRWIYYLRGISA